MFWDSSALVPCLVPEQESAQTTALLSQDSAVTIWWVTPVECASALEQKRRDPRNPLPNDVYTNGHERLAALTAAADHVEPTDQVRQQARQYLQQHPLRAADALQLAAAFISHQPALVTLDQKLRAAAETEGFLVLPERP